MNHRRRIAPIAVAFGVVLVIAAVTGAAALATRTPTPAPTWTVSAPTTPPKSAPARTDWPRPPLPDVTSPSVWASWALLDLSTGQTTAGGEPGTSTTEHVIAVGIAADYFDWLDQAGRGPSEGEADQLGQALRENDADATQHLYTARGGADIIGRLTAACGLVDTRPGPGWADTLTSAADLARLGACTAQAKLAPPPSVAWILDQMRNATDRTGFVEARPVDHGRPLAAKNGWAIRADGIHVACLAVTDRWTLAALVRYPPDLGRIFGATVCADVAAAIAPHDETAPTPTTKVSAGAVGRRGGG